MIVVGNAACTIEGGTAALQCFSFFGKRGNKHASVPEKEERGGGKECVFLSVHKGQRGKRGGKMEYLFKWQRACFSAGRPCCLLSGSS